MATAQLEKTWTFGAESSGIMMTPQEFDRAHFEDFEEGYRYELINGVLVVSPIPSEQEADPNEELGHLLRTYREEHPKGSALDATLPERIIRAGRNRRRVDRVIWAGLGRMPLKNEKPTVAVEFVSKGKRNRRRDYVIKKAEYMRLRIAEYWLIDRFRRVMTVFSQTNGKTRTQVIQANQVYRTPLLPGFELPLARLLKMSDRWRELEKDEQP